LGNQKNQQQPVIIKFLGAFCSIVLQVVDFKVQIFKRALLLNPLLLFSAKLFVVLLFERAPTGDILLRYLQKKYSIEKILLQNSYIHT